MKIPHNDCGEGWNKIIHTLVQMCQDNNIEIHQIKEKFGSLRFYVGKAPDWVHDIIVWAEHKSERTCEKCGQPGKLRSGSWVKTLCDKCDKPR